eukprot:1956932-Pyramimonas_sp.AAC.1
MTCPSTDAADCGSRLSSRASVGVGQYTTTMTAARGAGVATTFFLDSYGRQNNRNIPWSEIDFEVLGKQAGVGP